MGAKETTPMAQIDQQAAREELEQASQLRAKAEQLIEIADELHQQADSHEQDAQDLIAPAQFSVVFPTRPIITRAYRIVPARRRIRAAIFVAHSKYAIAARRSRGRPRIGADARADTARPCGTSPTRI